MGASAHACNPSYLGGRDQEDLSSRPVREKKFGKPHLNQKLDTVVCMSSQLRQQEM
jgi:hypothetical protein